MGLWARRRQEHPRPLASPSERLSPAAQPRGRRDDREVAGRLLRRCPVTIVVVETPTPREQQGKPRGDQRQSEVDQQNPRPAGDCEDELGGDDRQRNRDARPEVGREQHRPGRDEVHHPRDAVDRYPAQRLQRGPLDEGRVCPYFS
ncbi:hypothetical protein Krad_2397 [Kineococcus radiotolerans SRS30216 = ATCC BAA-149]|uniref:Uncharacterized protein n=1 Tax=Kineococcus radiotolerans (strain ATCC BAA-149 / DSM 14245 / SRS30216) TaxID=266940 RepID=A6WAN8_KINRD|nr:hypothetical protein Krad_2397 [Kineococcus radiotolerans SRS30216 = ATCC BAA-149]